MVMTMRVMPAASAVAPLVNSRFHLHPTHTNTNTNRPCCCWSPPIIPKLAATARTATTLLKVFKNTTTMTSVVVLEASLSAEEDEERHYSSRRGLVATVVAASGLVLLGMGVGCEKARAAGGPLLEEEFWDNVRRYALYALTVTTGAIYTIFQPVAELLKNPITAILVIVLLAGGVFLVSQVLTAMVGISEFPYNYTY